MCLYAKGFKRNLAGEEKMSCSIHVKAYSDNTSKEYQKHLKAVKFCIENKLSYPKETSDYFKGAIESDGDLEDYDSEYVLEYIENGFELDLPLEEDQCSAVLNVKDIPKDAKKIIIEYS